MAILGPDGLPYRNGEIAADDGIAVVKDRNWDRPYDDFALPHVTTFSAVIQGASRTYYHLWDEAMRHNRENALAMRRDPHLLRLLEERKRSLVKLKWHLKPDNEKDRWQKMVADALTRYIQAIPRFRRIRRQLLNATWYGRYGVQVKWDWQWDHELNQRHLQVLDHLPVNGDKINYGLDHTPYVLIYGAAEAMLPGAEVENTTLGRAIRLVGAWRDRFIIHTYDPDDADYFDAEMAAGVHGVGVRSRIYWHHWLRNEYISWVTDSLERIGLGIVVVEYDQSNAQAKSEALAVAKAISKKTVVVVPALKSGGSSAGAVKVVEMPLGGAEVCLKLQQAADDYLEKYLIGQMLSSDHRGSGGLGGGGAASFQKDTKYDIIADDAVDLDETLTGSAREMGLVHFIKKHTFPWADFPVRYVTDVPDPDSEKKLESINKAFSMGAGFVESEVTGLVGMSTPGPTDKVLSTKVQAEEALEVQKKAEGSQQPGQPGQQPGESDELQGDPEFDALQGDHELQGQLASAGGNISTTGQQRSPVVQQRLEGEVLRYRAESGGRWLTIGAKHGKGTHVFIENGRITKGHPRLLGKKISALGDLPDHRASWDKVYRRSRDLQARDAQVNPRELHTLAGEMLAHDKASVADELRFRRRANDLSIRNGFGSVQNLAHRAAGGKLDQTSIRNFDVLTTAVYGEFPEYFAGVDEHDRPGKLFEMLTKPRPEPMQEDDAYNSALEQLKAEYAAVPFELRGWAMRYYDSPGSSSGPIHYIDQPTNTSESGGGSGASAGGMAGTPEGAGSRSGHNPLMPSLPGQATRPPGSLLPPASSGKISPSGTHGLHEKVAKALTEPPQPGAFGEHLGIKNGPHVSDLLLNKETPFHQATAEDHAATLKALEEFRQTPSKSFQLYGKLARSAPGPMATPEEQHGHDVRMNLMEQHLQSLPPGKPGRLTKANAAHAFYVEGLEHAPPEQAQRTQQLLSKLPFTDVATTDPRTGVTTQGRVYLPPAGFEARQAFSHLPGQVNRYKDFLSPETQQQPGAAQPSLPPTAQAARPTAQPTAQAGATPSQPTGISLADFDQEPGQAGAVKQKQIGMAALTFQLTPEGDLDLHSLKSPQGYEGHARSAMQQLLGRVDEIGGMKVHVQPSPEQVNFYKGLGFKTVATVGGRPIMTREPQPPQRHATTPAEQPRTERPPSFELPDVGQPERKTLAGVPGGEQGRPAMGNPEENRFLEQRTRSAQGREARGGTPWVEHFFNALAKNPGPAASRPAVAEKPIDPTDMQAIEDFLLQEEPDKPIPTYEEISSWLQQSHFTPEQVHAAVQEANKAHREDSAKPQQAHDVGFGVNEAQLLAGHAGQAMEEGHPTPLHLTPEAVQRLHTRFGQAGDPTAPPLQHPPAKPVQAPGTQTPAERAADITAKVGGGWTRAQPGKKYFNPMEGSQPGIAEQPTKRPEEFVQPGFNEQKTLLPGQAGQTITPAATAPEPAKTTLPWRELKGKAGFAEFGGQRLQTLTGTAQNPLSADDHRLAGQAHIELGRRMEKAGDPRGAQAQYTAGQYHLDQMRQKTPPSVNIRQLSPEHLRASEKVEQSLNRAKGQDNFSPKMVSDYREEIHGVLAKVPQAAVAKINQAVRGINFYPSKESLKRALLQWHAVRGNTAVVEEIQHMDLLASCSWDEGGAILHLDGPDKDGNYTLSEFDSHELGHALDGLNSDYSRTPQWQAAYNAEKQGISLYARANAAEGFAEFARLVYSNKHSLPSIESDPKLKQCVAYFKQAGLWPSQPGQLPQGPQQSPPGAR